MIIFSLGYTSFEIKTNLLGSRIEGRRKKLCLIRKESLFPWRCATKKSNFSALYEIFPLRLSIIGGCKMQHTPCDIRLRGEKKRRKNLFENLHNWAQLDINIAKSLKPTQTTRKKKKIYSHSLTNISIIATLKRERFAYWWWVMTFSVPLGQSSTSPTQDCCRSSSSITSPLWTEWGKGTTT